MEKIIIVNSINPTDTKANAHTLTNFSYNSLLNILINQNTAISNDTRRHFVIKIAFKKKCGKNLKHFQKEIFAII